MTAVVIDDDFRCRALASRLLTRAGFQVLAACRDGASGLETVLAEKPDCVLLDMNLPDGDGLSIAGRLRAAGASSRIVLTSSDFSPGTSQLERFGVRTFVPKYELADADLVAAFGLDQP